MTETVIATQSLTKSFGKAEVVAGLDLTVERGQVFGFLGRNGAGKTTTIKMLMGLLRPTSGDARVLGLDPQTQGPELKQRVGYVPDVQQLYTWMKVAEIVAFTSRFYAGWDPARADDLLRRFGLKPEVKVKTLSRGMSARLALTLALAHDPELLILDEPATGLDVIVRRDFLESIVQVIQEEGKTVLLSSHLVHEVERVADRVGVIEQGKLLVCEDTDAFKGRVKKVLVRFRGADDDLLAVEGVSAIEGSGDRRLVTVGEYEDSVKSALTAAGAEVVDVIDMSLEESFIELVRPYVMQETGR